MKNSILIVAFVLMTFSIPLKAQTGNETQGSEAGANITTGDYQVMYGDSAGFSITNASYGVYVGYKAGKLYDSESDNIVIGPEAADQTSSGTDNIYIGKWVARSCTGTDNTVIGTEAAQNMSGYANDNTIIGEEAGEFLSDGDDNTFVGENAGSGGYSSGLNSASDNTYIGSASGFSNTTGYRNCFVGSQSGYDNTAGYRNTFVGDSAGLDCSIGHHNTFLGQASGSCTEYASYNTFVGSYAGWDNNRTNNNNNLDGMRNTYLGFRAGFTNREGRENVVIGSNADFGGTGTSSNNFNVIIGTYAKLSANNLSNNVLLGYGARINKNDAIAIGYNTSVYGQKSIGLGSQVTIDNQNAIGIGYQTQITGDYSIAIGFKDLITADSSATIGFNNSISGANTFAFGNNITSSATNSILLGGVNKHMTVGIGTIDPNQNASLDLAESDKGFLISRMTNAERTAFSDVLGATDNGMMVYDSEDAHLYTWNGTAWNTINTDVQDLELSGHTLSLTNDTSTVDLSSFMDNTDAQTLTLTDDDLAILNGNSINLSSYKDNTDTQELTLVTNTLSISGGTNTVDLSSYLDNTDTQTLSITEDVLTISGGNTVDLGAYVSSDDQNLSGASLTGTTLQIDIENGTSATVDLSSLQDGTGTDTQTLSLNGNDLTISDGNTIDLSSILTTLQNKVDELSSRVNSLEDQLDACCVGLKTAEITAPANNGILYQNAPNPWEENTVIKYYIPANAKTAFLEIRANSGQLIKRFDITTNGEGHVILPSAFFTAGIYLYTLQIDNRIIDTKKFVFNK